MSKRDSQLVALRQRQEKKRSAKDVEYLKRLGIKSRQELTPDLSMRSVHEPMNVFELAAAGNWPTLGRIGANIAEDVVRMPQQMFGPSGPEAERLHQLYGTQPERYSPELDPIEESQADLAQLIYSAIEPGPGGEARVFFGSPAQRARVLHFIDWARKNLRGEARKSLLQSLGEGWLLSGRRPSGSAIGMYEGPVHLGRGTGVTPPAKTAQWLEREADAALKEGPGGLTRFAKQSARFKRHWDKKKQDIVDEYKKYRKQGIDLPTSPEDTPVPPLHGITVQEGGAHPLSTILHEGIHASDFNMPKGRFNEAIDTVAKSPAFEQLKGMYDEGYISQAHEQLAVLLQRHASGEAPLTTAATGFDPILAKRQAQGWNIPALHGEFPKTPAGSRLEQRTIEPTLARWQRWQEASRGTGQLAGEPAFLEQLAREEGLAEKMKRRP